MKMAEEDEETLEASDEFEIEGETGDTIKKKRWFRRNWKYLLGIIVTIGLLTYLIISSNPKEIGLTLVHSNCLLLMAAFGCTIVLFFIKTLRWQALLKHQGHKVNFMQTFNLVLIGTFGSAVTPAKAGDILRAFYLSKKNPEIKVGTSVFSVVFDRILDLAGIFLIIAFSPFVLLKTNEVIKWQIPVGIVAGFIVFVIIVVLVFNKKITKPILNFILRYLSKMFKKKETKEKIDITTTEIIDDFYQSQKKYNIWNYLWFGFLSLLFWIILGFQGCVLLLAFGVANIDIYVVITTLCVAAIVAMTIPTSIAGYGIRDFVVITILGALMLTSKDKAISLSLIQTFMNVLLPGIIGALLLFVKPRRPKIDSATPS
jgi:uncharacterized protein (TIRG00374 family)